MRRLASATPLRERTRGGPSASSAWLDEYGSRQRGQAIGRGVWGIGRYVLYATGVCFALKFPIALLITLLDLERGGALSALLNDRGTLDVFFTAVVQAPLLETLLWQALPITAIYWLSRSHALAIAASTVLFTGVHVGWGWTSAALALPAGVVLAATFVIWRPKGWLVAFAVTAAVHLAHNAIAVGLPLLALELAAGG